MTKPAHVSEIQRLGADWIRAVKAVEQAQWERKRAYASLVNALPDVTRPVFVTVPGTTKAIEFFRNKKGVCVRICNELTDH